MLVVERQGPKVEIKEQRNWVVARIGADQYFVNAFLKVFREGKIFVILCVKGNPGPVQGGFDVNFGTKGRRDWSVCSRLRTVG